ncbi:relaxase domain-containing protein [Actinospica sp. MGRD01-02]|uniref:Relaxase domain-containing protein n=1 Tax=Actinospica acidithermotolerans TaxID=2828514 RepID=A0A941EDS0_9ACTN|nr:relaxase domain-containing protein [Actinospica acidithermotolerans]MBR7828773.1 relaxase domain-containing protein [Actinospica acidithermotolerans]
MGASPTHPTPDVQAIREADLPLFARGRHLDLMIAAPKSVSVLLASYLSAGRQDGVFQTRMAHTVAIEAAFNYLQKEAGYVRDGAAYLDATLHLRALDHIAAERETGDPHLHTHLIMDLMATGPAGRELPVYRGGVDAVRPAVHAIYDATLEVELHRTVGVAMATRPGSDRREVAGIDDAHIKAFRGSRCTIGLEQIVISD